MKNLRTNNNLKDQEPQFGYERVLNMIRDDRVYCEGSMITPAWYLNSDLGEGGKWDWDAMAFLKDGVDDEDNGIKIKLFSFEQLMSAFHDFYIMLDESADEDAYYRLYRFCDYETPLSFELEFLESKNPEHTESNIYSGDDGMYFEAKGATKFVTEEIESSWNIEELTTVAMEETDYQYAVYKINTNGELI